VTRGVYRPGASALHRAAPGLKLAARALYAVALSLADTVTVVAALAAPVPVAWAAAGLGRAALADNLKPVAWIVLALAAVQFLAGGAGAALRVALTLSALVAAAALVSATTRTDAMLDALRCALAPLERLNVDPASIAFALVFVVRLVPFVAAVGAEAVAARIARGGTRNPAAALVPAVIRLMRETDQIAEALVARGFGRP